MSQSKKIIHQLYNDLNQSKNNEFQDIEEVLIKVYSKMDTKDEVPLINRLVNFIYFKSVTEKITFSDQQSKLILELAQIGKSAGLNGVYRSDYGDKTQF